MSHPPAALKRADLEPRLPQNHRKFQREEAPLNATIDEQRQSYLTYTRR